MGDKTKIEWTDTTWNPVSGCTKVSEGCRHCYIERTPPFRTAGRRFEGPRGSGEPGATTGVILHEARMDQPLRWTKPRRVFVNSLSDLFHDSVPDEYIVRCLDVMANAHRHTFQVLTKRPARMRSLIRRYVDGDFVEDRAAGPLLFSRARPIPNLWLGVSVESQREADLRIPALLETPAAVRFLSCEPLLGPVDLGRHLYPTPCPSGCGCRWPDDADARECACDGPCRTEAWAADPHIGWVIVGGESGPGARPMHPDWSRHLRDQCQDAEIAFFFKQWGEYVYLDQMPAETGQRLDAAVNLGTPLREPVRVGKKAAGRLLDGREWSEYPP